MPFLKNHRRHKQFAPKRQKIALLIIAFVFIIATVVLICVTRNRLYEKAEQIAISKAYDIILSSINGKITDELTGNNYTYNYFVDWEKNAHGNITAISANASNISTFSQEILRNLSRESFTVNITIGDFSHFEYFHGKGLIIPAMVTLLEGTYSSFSNTIETPNANQIRHQISLNIHMPFDLTIKRKVITSEVQSKTIIAESIIVGQLP